MRKGNISLILSLIAIIASIVSICRSFPRQVEIGVDYLGLIVGMLAFLTAMLIAFIWNGYALRDKEIDKKLNLLQNSSKKAIAEDMFYTAYGELIKANVSYEAYRIALKKAIASLNLDFSEEKAELLFELRNANEFIRLWGRENSYIENQIKDLRNIKNKSKAIDSFINTLIEFKNKKNRKDDPNA